MNRLQRIVVVGLVVGFVATAVGMSAPASAQSAKQHKKQIEEYSTQLDALAEKDEWGVSEEDRKRARQWLENAKELLAQGNAETAGWLVTQTGEAIDLIRATVRVRELEAMADEQEETYHKLKEERIPKLESEIEELKGQKKELQSELDELE